MRLPAHSSCMFRGPQARQVLVDRAACTSGLLTSLTCCPSILLSWAPRHASQRIMLPSTRLPGQGTGQYRLHLKIERNPIAARRAKRHHGTRCQVCALDFAERYGAIGKGFIEAHHLRPIYSLAEGAAVVYDVAKDFAVLCSNCHRMIHRTADPSDLSGLRVLAAHAQGPLSENS